MDLLNDKNIESNEKSRFGVNNESDQLENKNKTVENVSFNNVKFRLNDKVMYRNS